MTVGKSERLAEKETDQELILYSIYCESNLMLTPVEGPAELQMAKVSLCCLKFIVLLLQNILLRLCRGEAICLLNV